MKTKKYILITIFLLFTANLSSQEQNNLTFRIVDIDGSPISDCEISIDGKPKVKNIPDGRFEFFYGNDTRQYHFELTNPETGIIKRFILNTKEGKNDFPTWLLAFNQISTYVRLENENYEIKSIFDNLDSCGVTDLFVETFYNGRTIYPSSVKGIGQHGNKDYLREVLDEARNHGIRIHASINTLCWHYSKSKENNLIPGDLLSINREGKANEGNENDFLFVSPSHPEVIKILSELVDELVSRYPDLYGINLDYIRFKSGIINKNNLNTHDFGYERTTREEFKKINKIDPHTIAFDTSYNSNWIKWIEYKENLITNLIIKLAAKAKLKRNNIMMTASVSPDYITQRGLNPICQNWPDFINYGKLDYLLQMCSSSENYPEEIKLMLPHLLNSLAVIILSCGSKNDPLDKQLEILKENHLLAEIGVWYYSDLKKKENQKLLKKLMFKERP
jgi:hypothetical protein